jgi:hypothetical protein
MDKDDDVKYFYDFPVKIPVSVKGVVLLDDYN